MYIAESCDNRKHLLPANFVHIGSLQLCQFATQSQICHTQYLFLTNSDDLLGLQLHTVGHTAAHCRALQLHTVGPQFFSHF